MSARGCRSVLLVGERKGVGRSAGFAARVLWCAAASTASVAVLGFVQAAAATTPLQQFYVVGKPLALSLPVTWQAVAPGSDPHLQFIAYAPNLNTYAGVADGFPQERDFASLSQYAVDTQRQFYATRYPGTTLRHRQRDLAVGHTVEVIIVVRAKSTDGRLRSMEIDSYWFEVERRTYNFSCVFPTALAATFAPICNSAAISLHKH